VSCRESVELIAAGKDAGLAVTAEATPHHLALDDALVDGVDELPPAHGDSKVNPPLRSRADALALESAVACGIIDVVATDHAPHTGSDKSGSYADAAFGFTGFELALPLMLDLVRRGVLPLSRAIERLTTGPARAFGLRAGTLGAGESADVTIFDTGAAWSPGRDGLVSKGKNTPLRGATLHGRVRYTIVSGVLYSVGGDHVLRAV
jgi:dihydroorotase